MTGFSRVSLCNYKWILLESFFEIKVSTTPSLSSVSTILEGILGSDTGGRVLDVWCPGGIPPSSLWVRSPGLDTQSQALLSCQQVNPPRIILIPTKPQNLGRQIQSCEVLLLWSLSSDSYQRVPNCELQLRGKRPPEEGDPAWLFGMTSNE